MQTKFEMYVYLHSFQRYVGGSKIQNRDVVGIGFILV